MTPTTTVAPRPNLLRRAVRALDTYTSERPHTGGTFHEPDPLFAGMTGASDGYLIGGLSWAVTGAVASLASAYTLKATNSRAAAWTAATVAGTACAAGVAAATGGHLTAYGLASAGVLFGLFEGLHTDHEALRRDGPNGTILAPALLPAGTVLPAAIGAGFGSAMKSAPAKALVAAGSAGVIEAGLNLLSPAHAISPALVAAAAVAGAVGPFIGPRILQGLRNMCEDVGKAINWVKVKAGGTPLSPRAQNAAGAPFIIFTKCFAMADGNLINTFWGSVIRSIDFAYLMWAARQHQKPQAGEASEKPAGVQPAGGAPAQPPAAVAAQPPAAVGAQPPAAVGAQPPAAVAAQPPAAVAAQPPAAVPVQPPAAVPAQPPAAVEVQPSVKS